MASADQMRRASARAAYCGMASALSLALMLMGGLVPVATYAVPMLCALVLLPVLLEFGKKAAWLTWAATAALGLMLGLDKEASFFYLFMGYYPIVKSFAERLKKPLWAWIVKEAVFIAALTAVWFLFRTLIFSGRYLELSPLIVYIGGIAVFTLYDIGLSRLIGYYIYKISPKIKRKR